jgi:hypothetical protein
VLDVHTRTLIFIPIAELERWEPQGSYKGTRAAALRRVRLALSLPRPDRRMNGLDRTTDSVEQFEPNRVEIDRVTQAKGEGRLQGRVRAHSDPVKLTPTRSENVTATDRQSRSVPDPPRHRQATEAPRLQAVYRDRPNGPVPSGLRGTASALEPGRETACTSSILAGSIPFVLSGTGDRWSHLSS